MRLVRPIGLRLIVWGGLVLVVVFYSGNLRSLPGLKTPSSSMVQEEESIEPSEPGWPQYRGPTYDGISTETGLADPSPGEGPPLLWKREIGRGYSDLIAVGSRVYTQGQTAFEQSVLCLDADTGATVWQRRYDWAYEPAGMYPGPRATPAWHAGRVYVASPDGLVGCLRAAHGSPIWSVNVNKKYAGRGTEFGYACSPRVEAGKVILPVGGLRASVVALSALDGSTVWASGSEPASYCFAIPITFLGRRLVIASLQNVLAAFDLESGQQVWQQVYSQGYDEHSAQPLHAEPHLMVMLPCQAGADLYRLEPQASPVNGASPAGLTARRVRHSGEICWISPALHRGRIYLRSPRRAACLVVGGPSPSQTAGAATPYESGGLEPLRSRPS